MPTSAHPKILVVDDDASTLLTVSALLEEEGYEVLRQETSLGTSSLVLREQPDLVLLDVNMPALNGDDLALLLRQSAHRARVRVVLYSGAPRDRLEHIVERTGADAYVQKGGDPMVLLNTLKRLLATRSSDRAPKARGAQ